MTVRRLHPLGSPPWISQFEQEVDFLSGKELFLCQACEKIPVCLK